MFLDCLSKAVFLFGIYNIVILLLFGVPTSLSNTYYLFKERANILKVLFPAMMTLLTVFLMPCWLQISEGSQFQFMSFLSAAGILFVGAAPAFKDNDLEHKVHVIAACSSAVFALLWIILVTPYWYVILIVFGVVAAVAGVTKTIKTGYIYWLEIVAFVSTFVAIISYYVNFIK